MHAGNRYVDSIHRESTIIWRHSYQSMHLTLESFISILSAAGVYLHAHGMDVNKLIKDVIENKGAVEFSVSDNLTHPPKSNE